ncbi:MAG: winged helix-turn-helix domain-containing protein [Pseudomonadota bacterium]
MNSTQPAFRLGPWRIDPRELTLTRTGTDPKNSSLQARSMELLVELHRHLGSVVSKDQLAAEVWGQEGASDELIARHISMIRQALGDDARSPSYLQTVPRRGYRLVEPATHQRRGLPYLAAAAVVLMGVVVWAVGQRASTLGPLPASDESNRMLGSSEPMLTAGPFRADISASPAAPDVAFIQGNSVDLAGALMVLDSQTDNLVHLADGLNRFPSFSPNGSQLAVFREDNGCHLLLVDRNSGQSVHRTPCGGQVSSPAAWLADDHLWFAVEDDSQSRLLSWRLSNPQPETLWTAPPGELLRFPVTAGERQFALLRQAGSDRLLELNRTGTPIGTLYGDPQTRIRWLSADPSDDQRLLLVKFDDVDQFSLFEEQLDRGTVTLISNRHAVQSAAYQPTGDGIVHNASRHRSQHQAFRLVQGRLEPVDLPPLEDGAVLQALVDPAGNRLLMLKRAGSGVELHLLDLRLGQTRQLRAGVSGQRLSFPSWSPDGQRITIASSQPRALLLLDAADGDEIARYELPFMPGASAIDERGGVRVLSRSNGTVSAFELDAASGDWVAGASYPADWGQFGADGKTLYLVDRRFRFGRVAGASQEPEWLFTVGSLSGWQVVGNRLLAACPDKPSQAALLCEFNLDSREVLIHPELTFYPSHLSISSNAGWLVLPRLPQLELDLMAASWAVPGRIAAPR